MRTGRLHAVELWGTVFNEWAQAEEQESVILVGRRLCPQCQSETCMGGEVRKLADAAIESAQE
jgi:hypothetical protein